MFYAGASRREQHHAGSAVLDVVLARMTQARSARQHVGVRGARRDVGGDRASACSAFRMWKARGAARSTPRDRRAAPPEFIDYFNSLVGAGTYVSVDAMNDPVLQPMRESYLVANNVVSMLDAAFVLNNRTYGMVCCEEPQRANGSRATWSRCARSSTRSRC